LPALARADNAIDAIIFGGPVKYTLAELADLAGTDVGHLQSLARWIGRPQRDAREVRYTDEDVAALQIALAYAEAENLDETSVASLVQGISSAMQRLAARQVEAIIEHTGTAHQVNDTQARLIAARLAPSQAAKLTPLMDHIYRRHFASAVRRLTTNAIAQRGLHDDDRNYPLLRAVGFADLVDFTKRTENSTAAEFTDLIRRFTDTCWEIVSSHGGRIVNFIGDAVFFVADDIRTGATIALELARPDAFGSCGPVRVGLVWSRVLSVYGDVFGPGVNLASRLATAATPDEVFVEEDAARMLARIGHFAVAEAEPFDAHGIGTVQPFRLRYANDPRGA